MKGNTVTRAHLAEAVYQEVGLSRNESAELVDSVLNEISDALARGESAPSPRLGIAIAPNFVARRLRRAVGLPDTEGLLIQQVTEDSPAARAGLSSGDLIVAVAGQPVGDVDDLFGALQGAQGGTLELRVVRGADERTVQVVFTPETEGN